MKNVLGNAEAEEIERDTGIKILFIYARIVEQKKNALNIWRVSVYIFCYFFFLAHGNNLTFSIVNPLQAMFATIGAKEEASWSRESLKDNLKYWGGIEAELPRLR